MVHCYWTWEGIVLMGYNEYARAGRAVQRGVVLSGRGCDDAGLRADGAGRDTPQAGPVYNSSAADLNRGQQGTFQSQAGSRLDALCIAR